MCFWFEEPNLINLRRRGFVFVVGGSKITDQLELSGRMVRDCDLQAEEYVRAFLKPFGADIGRATLWQDRTGHRIPISSEFFKDRAGKWKILKRDRATLTPLMAEALIDPDEIWIGVTEYASKELAIDRRYIRLDDRSGILIVMDMGSRWWDPVTSYNPTKKSGRPDLGLLHRRRGGKLLWKRK